MRLALYTALVVMLLGSCDYSEEFSPAISMGVAADTLQETNGFDYLEISLSSRLTEDVILNITLGGDAVQGVDYESIEETLIIPAGYSSAGIPIRTIDNVSFSGYRTLRIEVGVAEESKSLISNPDYEGSYLLLISDDDIQVNFRTDNSLPKSLILTRQLSELVNHEVDRQENVINSGTIDIASARESETYDVFIELQEPVTTSFDLTYDLEFWKNDLGLEESFTTTVTDNNLIRLISFKLGEDGIIFYQ